jgi:hypothetical protein
MNSGPSKPWQIILWGSSLPALLAASFLYFPHALSGPVFCPLALMTGMPCPGCGITRAFCFATHGRFREAFEYHAIWPLILAYFVFLWIYQIATSVKGEPPRLPTARIAGAAFAGLLLFWAVRLGWFFSHGGVDTMAHDNIVSRLGRMF